MIEELLPAEVRAVEVFQEPDEIFLHPEEAVCVARASHRRRCEFATGRHCARVALSMLGLPNRPIIRSERGAPVWPAGVVGSITHCTGYCAAAVAWADDLGSIGIDAEPNEPLPDQVWDIVSLPSERADLQRQGAEDGSVAWDRLLFSAKESVYKVWAPVTGQFLGFDEVEVKINPRDSTLVARFRDPRSDETINALGELHGRYLARNGLIVTTMISHARWPS